METILIAHNYSQKSFSVMSYELAHFLADVGYRVIFISHKPHFKEEKIINKGKGEIILISWNTEKRPTTLSDAIWYSKVHFKYKPKVIIGHFVGSNISIMMSKILSLNKTKTIEYYHTISSATLLDKNINLVIFKFQKFRKKIFYNLFCDTIICPSIFSQIDLAKSFAFKNSVVVNNPMLDRFNKKQTPSDNNIHISYLGRIEPAKGILEMITAFKAYKTKVLDSKLTLKIAGSGTLVKQMQDLIKNEKSIEFLGELAYSEVDVYLNKSHFVILPSLFDNLPTVGIESLMNQTPLLISTNTGLTDLLSTGVECFKFEPKINSIIEAFYEAENNFDKNLIMGISARNTYLKLFNINKYCEAIYKLL